MASHVFALIIGIDQYKSSHVWNLSSCADDAENMKRWLMDDLHVPRSNIRLLVDDKASKRAIEDAFMNHLVSNPAIESGDAIIVYFAGHGSSVAAPDDWCNGHPRRADILCTYDHCTRTGDRRVSGITDWSMHAMLAELAEAKGDNITLILDTCFSPSRSRLSDRLRSHTRWTQSTRLTDDDLYAGLWRNALSHKTPASTSRFHAPAQSHVTLLACKDGERAMEKEGGRFTCALLDARHALPLHSTSYGDIIDHLELPDGQTAVCVGRNAKRVLFNGIPFTSDPHYVAVSVSEEDVRIDAGEVHGIVEGSELSLHSHNVRGSLNPVLASLRVFEVHPTWSLARTKQPQAMQKLVDAGWARITRWNNRVPFRVQLKRTYFTLSRWWRLRQRVPQHGESVGGITLARVSQPEAADLSVRRRCRDIVLERHDTLIGRNCSGRINIPCPGPDDDVQAIDAAARFHFHLHRKNSTLSCPLRVQVSMALHRVDEATWAPIGPDLIDNGRAQLTLDSERPNVYALVLQNRSSHDLWPYLFWMDAYGYAISSLYHPTPSPSGPPLKKRSTFTIGTGGAGSEVLAFRFVGDGKTSSGFLKLFLSSAYVPMGVVEQGKQGGSSPLPTSDVPDEPKEDELWDSEVACITVMQSSGMEPRLT
ncbi:caspase domain-containing protein [Vararia minispora EC-137]|uniref:Caspase domain-containing protein n=1 Tax=Vararia minispora EC-137 TaxID=1314806 RepID=A0ACB8QZ82_9AGAM|nr:caspase domain-containing protein [Vararia minispora EC-137]